METELHQKLHLRADDVNFVRAQLTDALDSRVNLNLPSSGSDDPVRTEVLRYIREFVAESLEMSKHSLVIDGHNMANSGSIDSVLQSESTERVEIEPFDGALHERLRDVYSRLDAETLAISELRRRLPELAAKKYNEQLKADPFEAKLEALRAQEPAPAKAMEIPGSTAEVQTHLSSLLNEVGSLSDIVPDATAELSRTLDTLKYIDAMN